VEKVLQAMKVKRWQQKAADREEWTSIIMEAKYFRGA
jgi:plasmid maintenance system killer protein